MKLYKRWSFWYWISFFIYYFFYGIPSSTNTGTVMGIPKSVDYTLLAIFIFIPALYIWSVIKVVQVLINKIRSHGDKTNYIILLACFIISTLLITWYAFRLIYG
jgi:hypothetical protein